MSSLTRNDTGWFRQFCFFLLGGSCLISGPVWAQEADALGTVAVGSGHGVYTWNPSLSLQAKLGTKGLIRRCDWTGRCSSWRL